MTLPDFNPDSPPAMVPRNVHPLVWGLAYAVHVAHVPGADGWCVACRPRTLWRCPPSMMARRGFAFVFALQRRRERREWLRAVVLRTPGA